jgi:NAD(P)-dependent dehydrogenase (short-subunit alcohol dehydrogenase family)
MKLTDKKVVVLGGTSGIGFSVAEALLSEGAKVVVASSNQSKIDRTLARLGNLAQGHVVNLRSEDEIKRFFEQTGPFDHLVYTAGDSVVQGPVAETKLADAQDLWTVRFWGVFLAISHGHKFIQPGGSIVLTSSTLSRRAPVGMALGAGLSAAVEAFGQALAVELAPIRVNTVAPGIIDTEIWDRLPKEQREQYFELRGKTFPVGRVGLPSDVADAYLSFMRSPFTTGQTLVVDGGMLLPI